MDYFSTDQLGITLVDPSRDERLSLLESVLLEDPSDFPEVFLSGNSGIVIGYRADACLLWEESGEITRYLPDTDVPSAMHAWDLLIANDLAALNSLDWRSVETYEE